MNNIAILGLVVYIYKLKKELVDVKNELKNLKSKTNISKQLSVFLKVSSYERISISETLQKIRVYIDKHRLKHKERIFLIGRAGDALKKIINTELIIHEGGLSYNLFKRDGLTDSNLETLIKHNFITIQM